MRLLRAWFNKTFRKAQRQAILKAVNFKQEDDGTFEGKLTFDDTLFKPVLRLFVQVFQDLKCVHYFDITAYDEATMQAFTISVQKQTGIKPADLNVKMRKALIRITGLLGNHAARDIAIDTLAACNYLDEHGQPIISDQRL
jgi:hypothetical protein